MNSTTLLTETQTAELLGISNASVKNWVRHGYLVKSEGGFSKSEVHKLLARIQNGEIERLNSRANKKQAAGTILPPAEFRELCEIISKINLGIPELMFLITLRQFIQNNLADDLPLQVLLDFNKENYKTIPVYNHLKNRLAQLDEVHSRAFQEASDIILSLELPRVKPSETDIAGILYQGIRRRGDRSVSGSFYTPVEISRSMLTSAFKKLKDANPRFIDPCCGTGQFMLSFIAAGGSPENTYGIDTDSTAAFTAAGNILLECPEIVFQPKVFICDSLLEIPDGLPESFDLTATNPPWGACNSGKRGKLEARFPEIKSGESFSYFINRAFELTNEGGLVSVVLPESITNVRVHDDIRKFILRGGRITGIQKPGRIFKGVYTPVITMEIIREEKSSGGSPNGIFNINLHLQDSKIIDKIYSVPHSTLKGSADWALGIVTGDNRRFIKKTPAPGFEPIIRGSDIQPGSLKPASNFIEFKPENFQQTAPEWKYRAGDKLVYRFISKRLVFAADRQSSLTLNSANILLPRLSGYSAEQIMRLFNSDIYNYLFIKKFNSVKVLRSHLEELPLPEGLSFSDSLNLEHLFNLTETEIQHIRFQLR